MGRALYRKYRSQSLGDIVGQEHITTTLSNAIKNGRFAHAYLLTGPRGTGKTSVARILAHEVNGLPYSEDTHFDIIEIDAASNNGIEDVRSLREKVQSAPTSAKYKVYIIDEVHMLSKAAFNALLKTLEEPPEHVIFILATTEVHKVPETIISRTQRFSFKPIDQTKVVAHLRHIAKEEKITISDDALKLIAEHGEGSFRDSISLLDQASSFGGDVTLTKVEELLGRAPSELITTTLQSLASHDTVTLLTTVVALYDQGFEASTLASQLSSRLRKDFIDDKNDASRSKTLKLLKELLAVASSPRPKEMLELVLLEQAMPPVCTVRNDEKPSLQNSASVVSNDTAPKADITHNEPVENRPEPDSPELQAVDIRPESLETETRQKPSEEDITAKENQLINQDTSDDVEELWQQTLQAIKADHNTLYGIARMARPSLTGDALTLATKFPFHQKRLNEAKNRSIIATAVSELRGTDTSVSCIVATANKPENSDLSNISNIFGGAELL